MSKDQLRSANRLLRALPENAYQRLEPYLNSVTFSQGTILYEACDKIDTIYFPNTALISLVNILTSGTTTEVGLIGSTGMVGFPAILSDARSIYRAVVQIPGSCIKISALVLKQEFDRGEELQKLLLKYVQTRLSEVGQLAVCNRHHTIEERLARWLLMVEDLTQSEYLPLTQEFISHMLGVRRSGVTITANTFQQAGLIRYARGKITILDREALEDAACECYQVFRENSYHQ